MLNRYKLTYLTFDDERREFYTSATDIAHAMDKYVATLHKPHLARPEILSVERIKFDEIEIDRIADNAFNAAVKIVQDALGVPTGDNAAQWWQGEPLTEAMHLLKAYALHELRMGSNDSHVFASEVE